MSHFTKVFGMITNFYREDALLKMNVLVYMKKALYMWEISKISF